MQQLLELPPGARPTECQTQAAVAVMLGSAPELPGDLLGSVMGPFHSGVPAPVWLDE